MPKKPEELIPDVGEGLNNGAGNYKNARNAKNAKNEGGLWDTAKTVIFAVLIAMFVRTFAYEPFSIPSGSMIPTLLVGDYLFVSKASYGYSKHSFPFSMPLVSGPERVGFDEPKRGDVAVFKLPSDGRTDYIKRLIGLPGDKIQVKGGVLHINGKPVFREPAGIYTYRDTYGRVHNSKLYTEILPGGRRHMIIEESDQDLSDNTIEYTVPAGHYFAMGDNRDNSKDSRYLDAVGFIPAENLVGRAEVLVFSYTGSLWKFWQWDETLRTERFFKGLN
ncbi:MAG: signal peptidase I [Rhodospirillaceae bacterium]|nr:signal peptidase I [Rhodospirillaceae bacterium]